MRDHCGAIDVRITAVATANDPENTMKLTIIIPLIFPLAFPANANIVLRFATPGRKHRSVRRIWITAVPG
jgi:hypothetical protein